MLTTISGPEGACAAGNEFVCSDELGKDLIAGGYATAINVDVISAPSKQAIAEDTDSSEHKDEEVAASRSGKVVSRKRG